MPKRVFLPEVNNYITTLKTILATTRFNNKTWKENQDYLNKERENGNISNKIKCIKKIICYDNKIPFSSSSP